MVKLFILLITLLFLNGCQRIPSPKEWANGAVGLTLSELLAPASAKQNARQYINGEGKKVIIIPSYPTCDIHYILDKNEVVESYQLVGKDCR